MLTRRLVFSIFVMIVSPLMGLLYGFRDSSLNYKKWVLIIFITFYGSVINLSEGSDGFVHQNKVNTQYVGLDVGTFLMGCFDIVTLRANYDIQDDLFIHTVSFISGGILGIPQLFFVIVSFVFGYFYASSLFKIIKLNPNFRYSFVLYGFITVFVLWKGIEGINTVRTWTGLWVMFYGALSYLETKKLKYLFLVFIPQYIHVGYYVMAIPTWFVILFGSRPKIFSVLFFISFGFNILNPASVTERIEQVEVGKDKVKGYLVEEQQTVTDKYEESKERGANFYKNFYKAGLQLYVVSIIASVIILGGYYDRKMTFVESGLFSIGILTKVLSSSTWFIFALSNRTGTISGVFIMAAFVMMALRGAFKPEGKLYPKIEKYIINLCFIGFIPYLILKFSELLEFLSFFIVSTPFVVWFSSESNMSIKDAVKWLFQ